MSKKQQIVESAIQLFAQNGIEATSIQHITKVTGISKGAFYLSFSSKEELIMEIIDTFMKQFVADIDRVVNSDVTATTKLYQYFLEHLQLLETHADFAKMYAQEQMYSLNEEILEKLMVYDMLIDESLIKLFEELYPKETKSQHYDLLVSVKGFVRIYSQLVLFHPYPHDTQQIAEALVEKTTILALHTKKWYVTEEMVRIPLLNKTGETGIESIQATILDLKTEQHPPLIEESLEVLEEEMARSTPRQAVIKGLYSNFMEYSPTKWLSYLLNTMEPKKDAE
ncbi:TetR/AcrR family transcriptional regulator [Chryseomicrobium palamuruense]|uniref:TetR/AcrR family transcriptional regulator n=1 Tax=Chryseomicrobium palamuruense TaxID=682973 RepID=A0ABV8UY95_9BACL